MDGKGCWRDNVFVERLWRSVKYEEVYLKAYDSVGAARLGLARYFEFYNARRRTKATTGKRPTWSTSTRCRRCRPPRGLNHECMASTGASGGWQGLGLKKFKPQPIHLSQAAACSNERSWLYFILQFADWSAFVDKQAVVAERSAAAVQQLMTAALPRLQAAMASALKESGINTEK